MFRYSWDLSPYGSKVSDEDWQWRLDLDVGDVVDCPDENVWYNSTIVERTINHDDSIELKVGFRFYDPNGNLIDAKTN